MWMSLKTKLEMNLGIQQYRMLMIKYAGLHYKARKANARYCIAQELQSRNPEIPIQFYFWYVIPAWLEGAPRGDICMWSEQLPQTHRRMLEIRDDANDLLNFWMTGALSAAERIYQDHQIDSVVKPVGERAASALFNEKTP